MARPKVGKGQAGGFDSPVPPKTTPAGSLNAKRAEDIPDLLSRAIGKAISQGTRCRFMSFNISAIFANILRQYGLTVQAVFRLWTESIKPKTGKAVSIPDQKSVGHGQDRQRIVKKIIVTVFYV